MKKKLNLEKLELNSFVTTLDVNERKTIQGEAASVTFIIICCVVKTNGNNCTRWGNECGPTKLNCPSGAGVPQNCPKGTIQG